jgi:hypothetical protein
MGKHYVTQEYLRGFSSSPDQPFIWMFDKIRRKWSHAAIDKVAQERDYYPPDIEGRLTREVELPGHQALNRLRSRQPLAANDRGAFAYYLAVLVMRVPTKRRKGHDLVPEVLGSTMAKAREEIARIATEDHTVRVEEWLNVVDKIEQQYRLYPPPNVIAQINSPWPSEEVATAIHRMTWRVIDIPRDHFLLTTDNPVFFFDGYGLATAKSELTFPISSDRALLGSFQGAPGSTLLLKARPALVKEINRRLASGAERFLFTARRVSWIETLALKSNPYLNQIVW